jgi:hypothetical protein
MRSERRQHAYLARSKTQGGCELVLRGWRQCTVTRRAMARGLNHHIVVRC